VAELVLQAEAAIGFVEGEVSGDGLTVTEVAEDEMVLVAPPALAKGHRGRLAEADLKALPFVLREAGSGTRAIFEQALAARGISIAELNVALTLPSNEAVRLAVAAGAGAAALSRLVVRPLLKTGALVTLDVSLPRRRFYALRHAGRAMTKAEAAFYDLLQKEAASPSPSPI
jgi:DNA-binding transcriptional LysR family regulator